MRRRERWAALGPRPWIYQGGAEPPGGQRPAPTLMPPWVVGVYLLGFGMLVSTRLDRMRCEAERTAVVTRYAQALRDRKRYRMALEKDAALIGRELRTIASRT